MTWKPTWEPEDLKETLPKILSVSRI